MLELRFTDADAVEVAPLAMAGLVPQAPNVMFADMVRTLK
jgi:hypothetical protein